MNELKLFGQAAYLDSFTFADCSFSNRLGTRHRSTIPVNEPCVCRQVNHRRHLLNGIGRHVFGDVGWFAHAFEQIQL